jgi:hypothetical protein
MKFMSYMQTAVIGVTAILLSSTAVLVSMEPAAAVVSGGSRAETPADERPQRLRLDIPVTWQITRSRFEGGGASTETESYRELWTWEMGAAGEGRLRSVRANVPVYNSGTVRAADNLPQALVLTESDFARLVGLAPPSFSDRPGESRLVTLVLTRGPRSGIDLSINASDDEHFAIHFEVGTPTSL